MDATNGSDDNDSTAVILVLHNDNPHGDEISEIDILQFDLMTVDAIKKSCISC